MSKGQILTSAFGEGMMSHGFTALPNTILDYQEELKLTVREVYLIIKAIAFNWRGKGVIRDKDLGKNGRNFRRQRRSLEEKGYLTTKVIRSYKENRFATLGIEYNFFGLRKRIDELVIRDADVSKENVSGKVKNIKATEPLFDKPKEEPKKKSNTKNKSKNKKDIKKTIEKNIRAKENKKDKSVNIKNKSNSKNKNIKSEHQAKKENIKNEISENKMLSETEKFLNAYNKLHNETLGGYVDYSKRALYKKYVLEIHEIIKDSRVSCDDVLKTAKDIFTKIKAEKRNEYKLQDTVKIAVAKIKENKNSKVSIPSGADALNNILNKIKKGSSAKEAYHAHDS